MCHPDGEWRIALTSWAVNRVVSRKKKSCDTLFLFVNKACFHRRLCQKYTLPLIVRFNNTIKLSAFAPPPMSLSIGILSSNPMASLSGICLQVLLSSAAERLSSQTASLGSPERTQTPDWHNKPHHRHQTTNSRLGSQTCLWHRIFTYKQHVKKQEVFSVNALTQGKVPVYTKPVYFWKPTIFWPFFKLCSEIFKKCFSEEMEPLKTLQFMCQVFKWSFEVASLRGRWRNIVAAAR